MMMMMMIVTVLLTVGPRAGRRGTTPSVT